MKRFFQHIGKRPESVIYEDIQGFLSELQTNPMSILKGEVKTVSPSTYSNWVKALKRFFRDYLHKEELIKSFKCPKVQFTFKIVPSKEDLQTFYTALNKPVERALFLMYATTGLRRNECLNLKIGDINFDKHMVIPRATCSRTKHTGVTFFNKEAETTLREYLSTRKDELTPESELFPRCKNSIVSICKRVQNQTKVRITPQLLREWFCSEMGKLGIQDRYVDAFCGRVPKSVLSRHYTDFNPERLKEIYDGANLKVLS